MSAPRDIVLTGASGTIGRAVLARLLADGARVRCLVRPGRGAALPDGATPLVADATRPDGLDPRALDGADAVISCMASRSGAPDAARAVDHDAQLHLLRAAQAAGVGQFVLLSALCVQRPRLAFQHAKLAFEQALAVSGMSYSIVRPTAFFKSLSGQVPRVQAGKPFLMFGDGQRTACKPISNRDLASFIIGCLDAPERQGRVLPIGGPGPAITPLAQARMLFQLMGRPPRIRRVPVAMIDAIAGGLGLAARVAPRLQPKAEYARIGRYYATHSMLVLGPDGRPDADATPEYGTDTLRDHYARLLRGEAAVDLGAHAAFKGGDRA